MCNSKDKTRELFIEIGQCIQRINSGIEKNGMWISIPDSLKSESIKLKRYDLDHEVEVIHPLIESSDGDFCYVDDVVNALNGFLVISKEGSREYEYCEALIKWIEGK